MFDLRIYEVGPLDRQRPRSAFVVETKHASASEVGMFAHTPKLPPCQRVERMNDSYKMFRWERRDCIP